MPILVSACLLGEPCRYDGASKPCAEVIRLCKREGAVAICPEVAGGLPTPRVPSERVGDRVLTRDGRDVTEEYQRGAELALRAAREAQVTCAVLKAKSPSCGCGTVYDGTFSGRLVPGNGVTAELLKANGIPVYTEDQLPIQKL